MPLSSKNTQPFEQSSVMWGLVRDSCGRDMRKARVLTDQYYIVNGWGACMVYPVKTRH